MITPLTLTLAVAAACAAFALADLLLEASVWGRAARDARRTLDGCRADRGRRRAR